MRIISTDNFGSEFSPWLSKWNLREKTGSTCKLFIRWNVPSMKSKGNRVSDHNSDNALANMYAIIHSQDCFLDYLLMWRKLTFLKYSGLCGCLHGYLIYVYLLRLNITESRIRIESCFGRTHANNCTVPRNRTKLVRFTKISEFM